MWDAEVVAWFAVGRLRDLGGSMSLQAADLEVQLIHCELHVKHEYNTISIYIMSLFSTARSSFFVRVCSSSIL